MKRRSPGARGDADLAFGGAPELRDGRREGLAVDELHGVVVNASLATDGVDGDDVGVVELAGSAGLVLEALDELGIEEGGEGQDLEGDAPAERDLLGLVDHTHAAPAHLAEDAEVAEGPSGSGG